LNVVRACVEADAQYVGISMPQVNPSLYAATKTCARLIAEAYMNAEGLKCSHVVAYNAYGPGQAYGPGHPQKIIPTFATQGWAGEPITVWGDGMLTVDLVHVEDVARFLVAALQLTKGEIVHAGTGRGSSVIAVARKVQQWTGNKSPIVNLPHRQGERRKPTNLDVAQFDEVTASLGLLPELDWDRVRETVESYK
jgi:nucleoside-diphosphate-sugar epimerase